jgi:phosphoglycerate dehydrogenase-like enzyme
MIQPKSFSFQVDDSAIPDLRDLLDGAEIVIGDPCLIGPHWYNMPPSIKWIQSTWAGVDSIRDRYIDPNRELPEFIFTRLGSGFGPLIASYVIGQIIAVERHFYQYVQDQAAKKWIWVECEYGRYRRLSDLSVGILGVGAIGEEVAKVCKSLGMRVCGLVRRNVPIAERCPFVDEYFLMDSLPDLLHQCDYICNVLPSTEATRNLLSGDTLKNCKAKTRMA